MITSKLKLKLVILFICIAFTLSAQLVINEVVQGANNQEYVELVVVGTPVCPDVCVDVRGWIVDDNNGWHATGTGTGITNGHIRFADTSVWSCLKPGAMLVLYNQNDPYPGMPAIDETDSNEDCVYIIPYNSDLLERNATQPSVSNAAYTGPYIANGNWYDVNLSKTNDSYQLVNPLDLAQAHHVVSWGNNTNNTNIYFSYSATKQVYYMTNSNSNDPFDSANWSNGNVGIDDTPGFPNNIDNAAWIDSLSVGCVLTSFADAGLDVNYCLGQSTLTTLTATGGGYYEWSTSETSSSINVNPLSTTTYTVTVTAAAACTHVDEVTVFVHPLPTPTIIASDPICGSNTVNLNAGAGYLGYDWSNAEITQNITVTNPDNYTVIVTDSNNCTASTSTTILNVNFPIQFLRN